MVFSDVSKCHARSKGIKRFRISIALRTKSISYLKSGYVWYTYTMEYYSAIIKGQNCAICVTLAEMWMGLEIVIEGEVDHK